MAVSRPRAIFGAVVALLGALAALNGLVSGPRAFGLGGASVVGSVLAGLLLLLSGALVLRGSERPA